MERIIRKEVWDLAGSGLNTLVPTELAASQEARTSEEKAPGDSSGEWDERPISLFPNPRRRNLFPREKLVMHEI